MSVQLAAQQDFTTPDKGGLNNMSSASAMDASAFATSSTDMATSYPVNSVTPTEASLGNKKGISAGIVAATAASVAAACGKHVRFGAEDDKSGGSGGEAKQTTESPANSKRGLVSRRGGRCVTPGRQIVSGTASGGAASFRTPSAVKGENDAVPALCSASSVGLVSLPSECEKDKEIYEHHNNSDVKVKLEAFDGANRAGEVAPDSSRRPTSISISRNPSSQVPTSPLTKATPQKENPSFDDVDSKSYVRSPVPSTPADRYKKTPTKSPSQFQSLPSLDDPKLGSPVGFMLSPGPYTPYKAIRDSFEKETKEENNGEDSLDERVRDYSKEKFALTPTNFSIDYGKSPRPGIFDTSNVLNWLQSPTGNGLFSPGGGLNSLMNTPRGPIVPRTPGTPTVSTSFFFSDVACLPRDGDTTPKREAEPAKSPKKGLSNIICISPLASSRNRNGNQHAGNTPINYNDVFASPNPLLDDSPVKGLLKKAANGQQGSKGDPSLDVHLAQSDVLQDEDLSVLLQLAGGNTPRGPVDRAGKASVSGGQVFRGSGSKGDDSSDRENLPRLQLPIIGDRESNSTASRLMRKSHSRDHGGESDSFVAPSLGIRKSSSGSRGNEMFPDKESTISGNFDKLQHPGKPSSNEPEKPKSTSNSTTSKPHSSSVQSYPPPVHAHPYPPRPPSQDMYGYPSMPPHGMRPAGRMSVVVGGPPPSSRVSKPSPAAQRHMQATAHQRPSYSSESYPPPGMSYPPPHGHYPPRPVHMGGMGAHPYHSHYATPPPRHPHHPPPSHMPMYGAQHHPAPKISASPTASSKKPKPVKPSAKPPAKRPSDASDAGKPAKKPRKAPGPRSGKPKGKSPQLTDRADRQKAAQTIAAVNAASGGKNDKAAALAAAILRGVTMRPSGKWQAQLYFAGKSRYIGVFDTREKAALAYEIAREKLKTEKSAVDGALSPKQTENAVNSARKAAFDGVNEKDPRLAGK